QLLERVARLQTELVQLRASPRIGVECLGLAARVVQRAHEEPPEGLPQPVLRDEALELSDDVAGQTELDVGLDALLQRDEAEILEPPRLRQRELLVLELGERGPAPELERLAEQCSPGFSRRRPCVPDELLEAACVGVLAEDA